MNNRLKRERSAGFGAANGSAPSRTRDEEIEQLESELKSLQLDLWYWKRKIQPKINKVRAALRRKKKAQNSDYTA